MHPNDYHEAQPRAAELCLPSGTYSGWDRAADKVRHLWLSLFRGRPEDSYEIRALLRMAGGELLETLGLVVHDEVATRRKSELWLERLIALGLRPEHTCVEYGCGSLWCAEPVIRYLDPARFIGLDVTDRFYSLGCERLHALLGEKHVRLDVISDRSLRAVAHLMPDFVFSHRVLHHVPRRGLRRYTRNLCSLLNEKTVLVIEHQARPQRKSGVKARRHSAASLERHLPKNWHCREHSFGFVIAHRDRLELDAVLEYGT